MRLGPTGVIRKICVRNCSLNFNVGRRYDLLCLEGLVRALLVFQGKLKAPLYRLEPPAGQLQQLVLDPSVASVRPQVTSSELLGVTYLDL